MKKPGGPVTLVTCSGLSNTGRLTTQAAGMLRRRSPEIFEGHLTALQLKEDPGRILKEAGCLLVVDGCSDTCAAKRIRACGIEPDLHLIATECGIHKNGMAEVQFWEIEHLAAAIREVLER
jgi:uncharacterized metal-binding protein